MSAKHDECNCDQALELLKSLRIAKELLQEAVDSGTLNQKLYDHIVIFLGQEVIREALGQQTVLFGLQQQGHLPTIEKMLGAGESWDAIGKAIGWDPATASDWYNKALQEEKSK
jgi:hypothetical protein